MFSNGTQKAYYALSFDPAKSISAGSDELPPPARTRHAPSAAVFAGARRVRNRRANPNGLTRRDVAAAAATRPTTRTAIGGVGRAAVRGYRVTTPHGGSLRPPHRRRAHPQRAAPESPASSDALDRCEPTGRRREATATSGAESTGQ